MKINKLESVEVIVQGVAGTGNQQARIMFPDLPQLREKRITGIETFYSLDVSTTLTQRSVITAAQGLLAFLTLYMADPEGKPGVQGGEGDMGEFFKWCPLNRLHNMQNNTPTPFARHPLELPHIRVQWPKCYVQLATPLGNTTDVSFLFNVYYVNGNFKAPHFV